MLLIAHNLAGVHKSKCSAYIRGGRRIYFPTNHLDVLANAVPSAITYEKTRVIIRLCERRLMDSLSERSGYANWAGRLEPFSFRVDQFVPKLWLNICLDLYSDINWYGLSAQVVGRRVSADSNHVPSSKHFCTNWKRNSCVYRTLGSRFRQK